MHTAIRGRHWTRFSSLEFEEGLLSAGRVMFHGIHHVGLLCSNLEKSLAFYQELLGANRLCFVCDLWCGESSGTLLCAKTDVSMVLVMQIDTQFSVEALPDCVNSWSPEKRNVVVARPFL